MEIMEEPCAIPFEYILNYSLKGDHPKTVFIQNLIIHYGCFQDKVEHRFSKWNSANPKKKPFAIPSKAERPKIGMRDNSKEALIKKDFQGLLNKLTDKNFEVILKQVQSLFNPDYLNVFIEILWFYLQRQPEFQALYIHILEKLYSMLSDDLYIDMGNLWNNIWRKYLNSKEWKLNRDLVETSQNYSDFCDYIKEKKRLIAVAQACARMMNIGMVNAEPFELLHDIIFHILKDQDPTNKVDQMCIECYVEQAKEYYKYLLLNIQRRMPSALESMIHDMMYLNVNKSCCFKINDFNEEVIKNVISCPVKIKSLYDLDDEL
jgi:hypothetical protein